MSDRTLELSAGGQLKRRMTGGFMISLVMSNRKSIKMLKSKEKYRSCEQRVASAGE